MEKVYNRDAWIISLNKQIKYMFLNFTFCKLFWLQKRGKIEKVEGLTPFSMIHILCILLEHYCRLR